MAEEKRKLNMEIITLVIKVLPGLGQKVCLIKMKLEMVTADTWVLNIF